MRQPTQYEIALYGPVMARVWILFSYLWPIEFDNDN